MNLWPIMTMIHEREGVSVTSVRARLARFRPPFVVSRRVVRAALQRMERWGFLRSRSAGGVRGARVIWFRPTRGGT